MSVATRKLDAVDTRTVFYVYVGACWIGGVALFGWGPLLFGTHFDSGVPFGKAALVRVAGAVLVAGGCLTVPLARSADPVIGRQGLIWYAVGHAFVWAALVLQSWAVLPQGAALVPMLVAGCAAFTFFYLHFTVSGEPAFEYGRGIVTLLNTPDQTTRLRTRYEDQIRRIVAREERHRLARDLHDSVKQEVFAIQMSAATAMARLGNDPKGTATALHHVDDAARSAVTALDAMLASLRDTPSGNRELADALKNQCEALALRTGARVSCEVGALPDEGTLPPGTHEAVFRIAQEALANVAKHARATQTSLRLEVEAEQVRLEVADNGVGVDEAATSSHGSGIAGMKARAAELHGTVTLADTPDGGTRVTLAVPVTLIDAGDAAEYRRRMVWSGLGLLALTGMLTQRAYTGGLAGAAPYLPMVLLVTIMLVRAWVAWRRSRGIGA